MYSQIEPTEYDEILPVSHPQKRIWYIEKINDDLPLHTIGGCWDIYGKVEVDHLMKAIQKTIANNPAISAKILEKDGNPYQAVTNIKMEPVDYYDFSGEINPLKSKEDWAQKLFRAKFDLDKKLYYIGIYKLSETHYGLAVAVHHIICDGWSVNLIEKEICAYYEDLQGGVDAIPVYRGNYAEYLRAEEEYLDSERFLKNQNFWLQKFSELPDGSLYKGTLSYAGDRKSYQLDEQMTHRLKSMINDFGCSLNLIFIALLGIYISKTENQEDLVIGVPVYNRFGKKQKSTVGMFTSTLPFRFSVKAKESFQDFVGRLKRLYKEYLANQRYPYDMLVQDLKLNKKGYDSLFKVSVNYYNTQFDETMNGIPVQADEYYCGCQSYQFQLTVEEWTKTITLNLDYKTEEISADSIAHMYLACVSMLESVLKKPEIPIQNISLESEEERHYKIVDLNQTVAPYPKKTVDQLFEEMVDKRPDAIALLMEGQQMTYHELNCQANQVARCLTAKKITAGSVVGVMMQHSFELVATILGIMKLNCTYLPVDPKYPVERIHYILEHSSSALLIVNQDRDDLKQSTCRVCDIRKQALSDFSDKNLGRSKTLDDIAYVIYTSGSTGRPKGVMIRHGGLTNYIVWAKKMYLKDAHEIMALYSSIAFDLTVTTLFTPLVSGNTIAIYMEHEEDVFILYRILEENIATVIKLTPAHLELIKEMDNRNSSVKRFIVGGDELKTSVSRQVHDSFGGMIEIYNEYGPTETVVGCMIHQYDPLSDIGVAVPIGKPADNVQLYVLDAHLNIVSGGAEGELHIAGDGLAAGYFGQPELTDEKFVENPFVSGSKMYKSGDLAKYGENGLIYYAGRVDHQVKIKGFRIELGEIENALLKHQNVIQAFVMRNPDDADQLVAYVILAEDDENRARSLKPWLKDFLPLYMIPSAFVRMEEFPLTVNGKLDHANFPAPSKSERSEGDRKDAQTGHEKALVRVMKKMLSVDEINLLDNYYQLGGDSIKAIQIASALKNEGLQIKVKDILSLETIEEMAMVITNCTENHVSQEKCTGTVTDTPITKWYFEQYGMKPALYNQYVCFTLQVRHEHPIINKAIEALLDQHDSLRIRYDVENTTLCYLDTSEQIPVRYKVVDAEDETMRIEIRKQSTEVLFDDAEQFLFLVTVCDLPQDRQEFVFTAHHLLVDGVSWRIIIEDFLVALQQLESVHSRVRLPEKTVSYQQWAGHLNEVAQYPNEKMKRYYERLKNMTFRLPGTKVSDGSKLDKRNTEERVISQHLLEQINEKMKYVYDLDLNEVLMLSLVLTLQDFARQEEIVIELERHGRDGFDHIDVSRTVGWFTNMYPLLLRVETDLSLEDKLKQLKDQYREIDKISIYYGIQTYLSPDGGKALKCPVRFNFLGDTDQILNQYQEIKDLEFGLAEDMTLKNDTQLDFLVAKRQNGLQLVLNYNEKTVSCTAATQLVDAYVKKIAEIAELCEEKDSKVFTPSDFDVADLSQSDLDFMLD